MEEIHTLQRTRVLRDMNLRTGFAGSKISPDRTFVNPAIDRLISEGGENFFHYLSWLGLANDPNMLLLSSKHHYYYDCNDLKGVKTLISLTKLNFIKHLDSFIHTVNNVVSPKTNFVGCFYDINSSGRARLPSRIYKRLINFIDLKVFNDIDKKNVSRLLEVNGFKVMDMTEINGVTFFITQNSDRE